MRRSSLRFACLLLLALPGTAEGQATDIAATYRAAADSLIRAATGDSAAYTRIGNLVDKFGHRIAGSRSLEAAIDWVLAEMGRDGLENVRGEPVQVTHWVRGEESAVLTRPRRDTLSLLGLGGSVGTPKGGITAPVLVVASFDELKQRAVGGARERSCCSTRRSRTTRRRGTIAPAARRPRPGRARWPA